MDSKFLIINGDLYQIIKYDKKCWYCDSKCETFVSICKNCRACRKKVKKSSEIVI